MKIFVDDLIRVLTDMHNDGYKYCELDFTEEEEFDGETLPAQIVLYGLDDGGNGSIEFDDIEVLNVDDEEISRYAFRGRTSAPKRKSIKKVKLEDF